jgi:membrane protease YdiL (CAAX protease family)
MVLGLLFVAAGVVLAQLGIAFLNPVLGRGSVLANSLATGLALVAAYLGYRAYVRLVEQRPLTELARPGAGWELGAGATLGLALCTAVIGGLWLLGLYQVTGQHEWPVLVNAIARNVPSAVIQDIVLLGIVFRPARAAGGLWPALLAATLLFGGLHLLSAEASPTSVLAAALAGLLLIVAFLRTGHLWLAIGIHGAWDLAGDGIFGVGLSDTVGTPIQGLLQAHLSGPALLTGGAAGPQASILAILALGIAVAGLGWSARRARTPRPAGEPVAV